MKPLAQINVIPFIDIMLVLLAVVLTSATFIAEGRIPVTLPEATQADTLVSEQVLEVSVDAGGQVYLADRPVSMEEVTARLDAMAPSSPVRLRVDAQAAFEHFVAIVDLLKAHDMHNVAILTLRAGQ